MTDAAVFTGRAAVRAGILVTGTEVLTGIISDRNGPWLSEQLRDLGVDAAMIVVGAHGWGAFKRLVFGSVSLGVLHEAPCPVLVVRAPAPGETTWVDERAAVAQ